MARMSKPEKAAKKLEKKKQKLKMKRRKRINSRIERTLAFLAVLVCISFSVMEALDNRKCKIRNDSAEGV